MLSHITSILFALLVLAKSSVSNPVQIRDAACSAAVNSLATGINNNIEVQRDEVKLATQLSKILATSPPNENDFKSTTASLLTTVQKGITVRQKNQAIAPAGNGAIPGLATVAKAQDEELKLAKSLGSGGINVSRDSMAVQKLIGDFNGGIAQNQKNLAAATAGCKPSSATKPKDSKAPNDAKPKDAKPNDAKPNDAKPKDAKPKDAKPKDAKPNDAKPKDAKPKDAKPKDAKPKDAKPKDAKPNDAKPKDAKPKEATKPNNAPMSGGNKPPGTGSRKTPKRNGQ